ncbi:MAG: DUF11 domain-containing protein [Proteobacteria bacterium]|nr:DUF11 domain-containing protein [Pseudomonadota bacterium]
MKTFNNKFIAGSFVLLALFLTSSVATAQETGAIQIQTSADVEIIETDASGETVTRLEPASKVVPGDIVIYTVSFSNTGSEPAENVVITNPVPRHMEYVDGTAFGPGADISFSIDGGQSWGTPEELVVTAADGTQRPAQASDYTDIRWILRNELQPGAQGFARFRTRLQ